jgi:RNA polymerase subunit RPABC4/transcription elongation factor Spt4
MAEVHKLVLEGTLDTCPVCGYTDGFHVSFNVARGERQIILICPQCHNRFDPDWTI